MYQYGYPKLSLYSQEAHPKTSPVVCRYSAQKIRRCRYRNRKNPMRTMQMTFLFSFLSKMIVNTFLIRTDPVPVYLCIVSICPEHPYCFSFSIIIPNIPERVKYLSRLGMNTLDIFKELHVQILLFQYGQIALYLLTYYQLLICDRDNPSCTFYIRLHGLIRIPRRLL